MPISIQNGLKDWIKLYNSVFGDGDNFKDGKTNRAKLKKGFTNNPNILLFDDLSSQTGTNQPFIHNGANYRLYEDLEGIKALERELLLGQNEKVEGIRKLQGEVDSEKRKITNKTSENKKVALEVSKIADEILEKKKEALKAYKLEDGFDGDHIRERITLRKIHKLILEIRYLENNGDATKKCPFENDATNHCQTLVGTFDTATNTITEEDLDTRLNVEGIFSEFYLVGY